MELNKEHIAILDHTLHRAAGNRYCGDSEEMQELCKEGLMKSLGKVAWCPDEYFIITDKGRSVLNLAIKMVDCSTKS